LIADGAAIHIIFPKEVLKMHLFTEGRGPVLGILAWRVRLCPMIPHGDYCKKGHFNLGKRYLQKRYLQNRSKKHLTSFLTPILKKALATFLALIGIAWVLPFEAMAACQVTLAWDRVTTGSIAGYRLFLRGEGQTYSNGNPIWEGSQNQCTISDLNENTAYSFDDEGHESRNSNEVRFFLDLNKPRMPEAIAPADGAQNIAPEAELATGAFYDVDRGDHHVDTQWQIRRVSDNFLCFSLLSDFFLTDLTLPPLILDGNTSYRWAVRYGNQNSSYSDPGGGEFTTGSRADANENGILDFQEISGVSDLDRNGQADSSQPGFKSLKAFRSGINVGAGSAPGFSVNVNAMQAIDHQTLTSHYSGQLTLPIDLLAMKLTVPNPGSAVEIAIYFSATIPDNYTWVNYNFESGYMNHACRIATNRLSMIIRLQDGGAGDLDGVANGQIVTIGSYGRLGAAPNNIGGSGGGGGGGGGGGCFIKSLSRF
jgi:hypothetical protein